MKIFRVAVNKEDDNYEKMKEWFDTRTKKHIALVDKYAKKIHKYDSDRFSGILARMKGHDQSKFKAPEIEPYIYTTWKYKCEADGVEFECPKEMEDKMVEATEHHIKNNPHHPEYHCDQSDNLINTDDRDKPPEEMIDATKMPDLDISEMCADWMAVSDEKGSSPKTWADNNVNVRWKFDDAQKDLIYELIDAVWDK